MQMITLNRDDIYQGSLVLVNHNYAIAPNYQVAKCLVDQKSKVFLEQTTMEMLKKALTQINGEDKIILVSGLRSAQEQAKIYEESLRHHGQDFTSKFVSQVNCSEHQTGLAVDLALNQTKNDLICPDFPVSGICQQFQKIASNHGFIQRYPKDKIDITKISAEPWHFRYVGVLHAKIMEQNQWCLEEYHLYIKNHTILNPYFFEYNGKIAEVFYVPAVYEQTVLNLSEHNYYQISGNNIDGFVIASWRSYV